MRKKASLTRLTTRYYCFSFIHQLNLWAPVYILFLLDRSFTLSQATLLSSIWWATAVIFELPTGLLADRWGRKTSLAMSALVLVFAFITLSSARSFASVTVAYMLWAIAVSLSSGADSALLYDWVLELGAENKYQRILGRASAIGLAASAVGALCGGLIGEVNISYPIKASAVLAIVQLLIVLTLREPRTISSRMSVRGQMKLLATGLLTKELWGIMIVSGIIYTGIWVLGVFYQPYLQDLGFSVATIGVFFLGFKLAGMMGSYSSVAIGTYLGLPRQLFTTPIVLALVIFALSRAHLPWAIVLIAATFFINSSLKPLISTLINQRVESTHRATVLSLNNLIGSAILVPIQPLLGSFGNTYGIQPGFVLIGALIVIGAVIAITVSRSITIDRHIQPK